MYNITHWCAIDDRNFIDPLGLDDSKEIKQKCFEIMCNHFVHTNEEDGLTDKVYARCNIQIELANMKSQRENL